MFESTPGAQPPQDESGSSTDDAADSTAALDTVALTHLGTGAAGLEQLPWDRLDHTALLDLIGRLQTVSRAVEAAVAVGMAAADRRVVTERTTGLSAANWWARARLGSGGQGAWLVRAGDLIGCFPHLGRAVVRGELTLEHLRAIDEIGDPAVLRELVGIDEELHAEASKVTLAQWRRCLKVRVSEVREELARRAEARRDAEPQGEEPQAVDPSDAGPPDAEPCGEGVADTEPPPDDPGAPPAAGGPEAGPADTADQADLFDHPDGGPEERAGSDDGWLSLRPTADGGVLIRGRFLGPSAELLRQALDAATSHQRRAAWREHETLGIPIPGTGQLRARALVELLRRGAATDLRCSAPARTEAVVVVQADDRAAERVRALDGEPLTPETAALLACDAHFMALVVDRRGQPLWLGRSTRLASTAQRRALVVRDGGCVFPGCDMPAEWCDAHHQPGWEHGGTTDIDTMALLCRRHHGAVHSQRWLLRPAGDETSTSDGLPRSGAPPGRTPSRAPHGLRRSGAPPGGVDQRFEWHDRLTGRTVPAQQRGLGDVAA